MFSLIQITSKTTRTILVSTLTTKTLYNWLLTRLESKCNALRLLMIKGPAVAKCVWKFDAWEFRRECRLW